MKRFHSCLTVFTVLISATISQAGDPNTACLSGKLNLSGSYAACRLKTDALAAKLGVPANYSKCETAFNTKFPATEVKAVNANGQCPSEGDVDLIKQKIDDLENDVDALLSANRLESLGTTILDHETGLEWEEKEVGVPGMDYSNPHDANNTYTWCAGDTLNCDDPTNPPDGTVTTDFLAKLNGSNSGVCFAGHCDWRLPTSSEAASIPSDAVFQPFANSFYWCGDTYAGDPGDAWNFYTFTSVTHTSKGSALFARAVRGGN